MTHAANSRPLGGLLDLFQQNPRGHLFGRLEKGDTRTGRSMGSGRDVDVILESGGKGASVGGRSTRGTAAVPDGGVPAERHQGRTPQQLGLDAVDDVGEESGILRKLYRFQLRRDPGRRDAHRNRISRPFLFSVVSFYDL